MGSSMNGTAVLAIESAEAALRAGLLALGAARAALAPAPAPPAPPGCRWCGSADLMEVATVNGPEALCRGCNRTQKE